MCFFIIIFCFQFRISSFHFLLYRYCTMDFLNELNDRQKDAAEVMQGPLLIVAGAGSGKTRALTYRVANVIAKGLAQPWQILAVTFTNKAAGEMSHRIQSLLQQHFDFSEKNRPMIGTFHSICVRILRRHFERLGREGTFVIYDTDDTKQLMRRIMKEKQIDDDRLKPQIVLGMISKAKNALKSADDFKTCAGNYFERQVADLFMAYQERLRKNNAVDFDDLLFYTVQLFREHSDVLDEYQERWRFMNVDEYQDTNHAQYVLIKLLASKYRNICVIGDSDQSIYSFRGANIQNILNFEKDYPDAKLIKLEQNYRSTQIILDVADAIIAKNKSRKPKVMWTNEPGGKLIDVWHCQSEQDETKRVAEEIRRLHSEESVPLNHIVVLYRTNVQSRLMEEMLLRYVLPYKVIGGVKFYARREVKDLLAYLRAIHNNNDTESLLRIINIPSRRIGATAIQKLQAFALARSLTLSEVLGHVEMISELSARQQESLKSFWKQMEHWRSLSRTVPVSELAIKVIHDIQYKAYLIDGTEEGEMRHENVMEFVSVATKYDALEADLSLASFLEEVALVAETDQIKEEEDVVTLMTLHAVKGLEYAYVFIVGCEENIFPHMRSMFDEQQMEEERRLMYVGVTRARKKLYLLAAKERRLFGDYQKNPVSRFIHDIPKKLINAVDFDPLSASDDIDFEIDQNADTDSFRLSAEERFKDGEKIRHTVFG
ncbi:ATP-dependent DNA helicase PcrA, partial [Candidatus Peregrinibacteria bacterium CG_4_10_14_0_2_um_filter_43_11]